jgi:hypothetical protein
LPQGHFLIIDVYFRQQYPQQYDSIVPPEAYRAFFHLCLPLKE